MNLKPKQLEFIYKSDCVYTSCYCEENVWKLVEKVQKESVDDLSGYYVVFVSNNIKAVPLWKQAASTKEDGFVLWDYHVFLIYDSGQFSHEIENNSWVFDLDSQLSFPCTFSNYVKETFKSDDNIKPEFHRFFRVVKSSDYLKYFASDRHHMKNQNGLWIKPPPDYEPIFTNESMHNLPEYINMSNVNEELPHFGTIYNLSKFCDRFLKPQANAYQLDDHLLEPNWM
uniref:Protein N-terminal glutamine amidohydrolase n=1 Tax=Clastoptera arizonana TaxID=38151 RepID=A0A1B6E4T0_9HEMI